MQPLCHDRTDEARLADHGVRGRLTERHHAATLNAVVISRSPRPSSARSRDLDFFSRDAKLG
jgi:hypothetical protein